MRRTIVPLFIAVCCSAGVAAAAEITILSGGAAKGGLDGALAAWEKKTGDKVTPTYAPAGDQRRKIAAGERMDILIIPVENLESLAKEGAIDISTRRDIAGVSIGVAVRQGAPVPDISTPDKLKDALLATKSLTYMDPARGTSGKHFDEQVLPQLGIRDAVRSKATLGEGGYIAEKVAKGEVDLVVHSLTEIRPVAGVTIVGPLPAELQKTSIYSGVVMKGAKNPEGAKALLDYLASAPARDFFLQKGYSAP